jgi:hypothetical protein
MYTTINQQSIGAVVPGGRQDRMGSLASTTQRAGGNACSVSSIAASLSFGDVDRKLEREAINLPIHFSFQVAYVRTYFSEAAALSRSPATTQVSGNGTLWLT